MAPRPSATERPARPGDAPADEAAASLGERLASAVTDQDARTLASLLHPDVDFRAMTPGRFWETRGSAAVVDVVLGAWFGPERRITGLPAVDADRDGPMERVGYRFAVSRPDGWFTVEQQAYLGSEGDLISRLWIMCTGFVPDAGLAPDRDDRPDDRYHPAP